MCGCTGETAAQLCSVNGKNCGDATLTDRCGVSRTVACGTCNPGLTCSAFTPNVCGCIPETDAAFCAAANYQCGPLSRSDNCGVYRSVTSCGTCQSPLVCGARNLMGKCACSETDAAMCMRLGAFCGTFTVNDVCGLSRTISCGSCVNPQTCGAVQPNVCGCVGETDAQLCSSAQLTCGILPVTDRCNVARRADCGTCTVATGAGPMGGLQAGASWPMEAYGPHRQSRSNWPGPKVNSPSTALTRVWNTTSTNIVGAAVAANSTIYGAGMGATVRALSSLDGRTAWTYGVENITAGVPAIAADGTTWVGTVNAKVHAISPSGVALSGWPKTAACTSANATTNPWFGGSPVIDAAGNVYLVCLDGQVYKATSTALSLLVDLRERTRAPAAVGLDGTVYVGTMAGTLHAISPNGTVLWSLPMGGTLPFKIWGLALSSDGQTVYVPMSDGRLRAVKSQLWPVANERGTLKWTWDPGFAEGFELPPAIAADGTILFGSVLGRLFAITDNGTSASRRWVYTVGQGRSTSFPTDPAYDYAHTAPLIAGNGVVYIGTYFGNVHGVDISTGAPAHTRLNVETSNYTVDNLALSVDGRLLVTSGGSTFAFR